MTIEEEDPDELVTIQQETELRSFGCCDWDNEGTTERGWRRRTGMCPRGDIQMHCYHTDNAVERELIGGCIK